MRSLYFRIPDIDAERSKRYETEWVLVVLVGYVNISTPTYLKCTLVVTLVIYT